MSAEAPAHPETTATYSGEAVVERLDNILVQVGASGLMTKELLELGGVLPDESMKRPALVTEWFSGDNPDEQYRFAIVRRRLTRMRNFVLIERRLASNPDSVHRLAGIGPDGFTFSPYKSYSGGFREIREQNRLDEVTQAVDCFWQYMNSHVGRR